ncbi:MAG: Omp28-related outer membrane protein [Bacteroidota bacterium]
MKRALLLGFFCCLLAQNSLDAQGVKRYVLLEHFTNTRCVICSSRNPPFFAILDQYPDVHHIAYHPPVPYPNCLIYESNPTENADRANYYDIFGTPRVFLNGTATGPGALITTQALDATLSDTSPLGIVVSETEGNDREVNVDIQTYGQAPGGDLKLYVAILEKRYNYNAPNGESVHHNVFRQFLANGVDFSPAADGEGVQLSYNYTLDPSWTAEEIYVMAYVQDDATREIINSGNRFDEGITTSTQDSKGQTLDWSASPNPANNEIFINLDNAQGENTVLRLQDAVGRQVWFEQSRALRYNLPVEDFPSGVYFLRLERGAQSKVIKLVIQH